MVDMALWQVGKRNRGVLDEFIRTKGLDPGKSEPFLVVSVAPARALTLALASKRARINTN